MHIMLDLETWGKHPGCDIRSIGAVVFDPTYGYVAIPSGDENNDAKSFYIATENATGRMRNGEFFPELATGAEDYRKYPLTRDPETVEWWGKQSPEAQAAFANPVDLRDACLKFADWLHYQIKDGPYPSENVRLWANGPHFDVSILEAVYHAVNLPVPWHYRAPRDFRTITDVAGMKYEEYCNYGDAHNALHDAIAQAMTVCEAYKRLGIGRGQTA